MTRTAEVPQRGTLADGGPAGVPRLVVNAKRRWLSRGERAEIVARYHGGATARRLAAEFGIARDTVYRLAREAAAPHHATRGLRRRHRVQSRLGSSFILDAAHPAVVEGRTLFPTRVIEADAVARVLKSGEHQRKIGDRVMKGRWRGYPIYTLTLEERASCPRSCEQWRSCYGNRMRWPLRHRAGPALERAIETDLAGLQARHPGGFVVRLHILGDFYSLDYVRAWARRLDRFPALRVYGYTARGLDAPIGIYLRALSARRWDRFAVRFSGAGLAERSAIVVGAEANAGDAIVCPAQTGRSACCATCGLCWGTRRNIAFLQH